HGFADRSRQRKMSWSPFSSVDETHTLHREPFPRVKYCISGLECELIQPASLVCTSGISRPTTRSHLPSGHAPERFLSDRGHSDILVRWSMLRTSVCEHDRGEGVSPTMAAAALPLYDLPELRSATDAWWGGLARALRSHGVEKVPRQLSREQPVEALWQRP